MKNIALFVKSLRIEQWVKNIFIFAPVIFSLNFFQLSYLKNSFIAFILFSFLTGSIYVLNDCIDKESDKYHPKKSKRPIASGKLNVKFAAIGAISILIVTLLIIYLFNLYFLLISIIYVITTILYSFHLKKIVILDVMIISLGFVLRILIGGVINDIDLSLWILVITFLLSLFLGLIKRRQELVTMNLEKVQSNTRKTLKYYNLPFLDQLISITTATTLISYIIYVLNEEILKKFNTKFLYLTVPFVVYGIFRYLFLTYSKGKGENPSEIIFSDLPFTLNMIIWVILFVILII